MSEPHWSERLLIDEQDRHLLTDYRLEYKRGSGNYWKVLAIKRGATRGKSRKYIALSRLIMNPCDDQEVDHINRDTLDNRRANLRLCLRHENAVNRHILAGKTSIYHGVHLSQGHWVAQIKWKRQTFYLGTFSDQRSAAKAYDAASIKLHREFAVLNFPDERDRRSI
jgi:hypothetical protein